MRDVGLEKAGIIGLVVEVVVKVVEPEFITCSEAAPSIKTANKATVVDTA